MRRSVLGISLAAALGIAALSATASVAQAQNAVLRGAVRSDNGEALVGANVYIVELNAQVATGEAGRFVLTVPGERVRGQQLQLRVRAIGYRPSSRPVTLTAGEQTVDFTLAADVNRLDEIVVTGVLEGTERTKLPFTVATIDMADVPVPAVDPIRLLAGRVPGANVTSGSGRPGAQAAVILRGPTSLNATGRGQGPLYIVDGAVVLGSLPEINPSDIENVEVVKGAAAASLYGARAGNGVIQITTRSGRRSADGTSFNLRVEGGGADIERDFGIARQTALLMDERNTRYCITATGAALCQRTIDWATEQARINNDAGEAVPSPQTFPLDPNSTTSGQPLRNGYQAQLFPGRTYNAVDQAITDNGFYNGALDMTARFDRTQVYASVSGLDQAGALRFLEGYQRGTARLNVDQRVGDAWQVGVRSYYARSREDGLAFEDGGAPFFRLTRMPASANILARDTLGRLHYRPQLQSSGSQNQNPMYDFANRTDYNYNDRFIGGITLRYAPASWVDLEGTGSYDYLGQSRQVLCDKGWRSTSAAGGAGNFCGANNGWVRAYDQQDRGISLAMNAGFRRNFGRDVLGRFSLRYLYEQQDQVWNDASGGTLAAVGIPQLSNATAGFSTTSNEQSIRQIGLFAGAGFEIKNRYIIDGLIRRDGSSLFGENNRWATFGRASLAWRLSQEGWWFGGNSINEFKLRASRGSAGGRPSFNAQYETFNVSVSGISFGTLGNNDLKPEVTTETEIGADMELFRRIGLNITYAWSATKDQIVLVPLAADRGYANQWQNIGTLETKAFELSANIPVVTRRDVSWTWNLAYDRVRTVIAELNIPPYTYGHPQQGAGSMFQAEEGLRYGTFFGRTFVRSCSDLPATYAADCGSTTSSFQYNDEGYVVWVGAGNSWQDGITRNLYQTSLPNAAAPWGVGLNFGMPIILREASCETAPSAFCAGRRVELGNALPDWQFSIAQTLQFRRLTVYAQLQGQIGRDVWNEGRHWAHLENIDDDSDQRNKSVQTAKPLGYYWRAPAADGFTGLGGFYDQLAPNAHFTEDASYAKLRELAVSYNVGSVAGVGNWTLSLVGRNLFTLTGYTGFDPEVGLTGGTASSAAINAVDAFTFPNTRSLTFSLSTSF